jgi:hypothetical protein
MFSRQCLGKRRVGDRVSLRKETRAWNRRVNRDRVAIEWKFTRKQARKKLGYTIMRSRYYSKSIFSNPKPCNRLRVVEAAFCWAVRKMPSANAASCI